MRNGYIFDTLTSADNKEIIRIGRKILEIYEGVLNTEKFEKSF